MDGAPAQRIVIAGGPRCGKTTYAAELARPSGLTVLHTDDLIGTRDWSEASTQVALWFQRSGPWIIEGVSAVRALRKWLQMYSFGKPCDLVVYMPTPFVGLDGGQRSMQKGCDKVWGEIVGALVVRGVKIQRGGQQQRQQPRQ